MQVVEKRCHSIRDKRVLLIAEGRAPVGAELAGHGLLHDGVLKAGVLAQLDQGVCVLLDVGRDIFKVKHRRADQNLAGHIAAQLSDDGSADFFSAQLCGVGLAGGNVRKADARTPAAAGALAVNARQIVVFILGQHAAFNDRAGRDNADDVALDKTLGEGRVLHLLTDGDLVALGDQACHVSLVGVERHAAHRGAFFLAAVFAGQRQFQLPRSRQRVVVEHFIEVTDAVEQNLVGMLFFDFKILLHHGRYCLLGHVSHSCFCLVDTLLCRGGHCPPAGRSPGLWAATGSDGRAMLAPTASYRASSFSGSRRRWSSCRCSRRWGPARSWGHRRS